MITFLLGIVLYIGIAKFYGDYTIRRIRSSKYLSHQLYGKARTRHEMAELTQLARFFCGMMWPLLLLLQVWDAINPYKEEG